jgi:hypothetical protein
MNMVAAGEKEQKGKLRADEENKVEKKRQS